jgi:hypothetical protein
LLNGISGREARRAVESGRRRAAWPHAPNRRISSGRWVGRRSSTSTCPALGAIMLALRFVLKQRGRSKLTTMAARCSRRPRWRNYLLTLARRRTLFHEARQRWSQDCEHGAFVVE